MVWYLGYGLPWRAEAWHWWLRKLVGITQVNWGKEIEKTLQNGLRDEVLPINDPHTPEKCAKGIVRLFICYQRVRHGKGAFLGLRENLKLFQNVTGL